MTPRRILLSGTDARLQVKEGADKLANAVKSTLGPFGTNALLEKGLRITNDGVRIAQEITLDDEVEDLGARKLKEAAAKANDQVGDGSTTIITLAQAILKESSRLLGTGRTIGSKMTTAEFLRTLKREYEEVLVKLNAMATPVASEEELIRSAVVAVEDDALGKIIGSVQWELGESGYILAEDSPNTTTTVERVHGIRIDNGFGASYLINNQEKQMLEVNGVRTIITDHTLQTLEPLKDILDQLLRQKIRKVAIIARGFTDQAIQDCAANIKGGYEIYPINAPFTDSKEVMKDLASILGGTFIDYETHSLEDMQLSDVGFAETIRARRFDAVITGAKDSSDGITARIAQLREQLSGSVSDFEHKTLLSRIAQLERGFAVIQVGAESDTERKRIYDKVEDAVNAVRAALQEGTVAGGGLAFKEIADSLPDDYILKRPLASIHEQVMANAPEDFVIEDWVRDPAKVLRIALEQAVSVSGDLATVSIVVTTKNERYNAYISNND
jgi:chaperonin GroEL